MLMAIIESIYETMNLRIQETAFELHLRKIYPTRNILSLRETETVSGQEGLDVQKKTDGSVNIIGEVATDPVAAWMIQAAQVASKFTLFTHHAKTFPDLVTALRNSMLRTGVFKNEKTAEEQVIQVLNFDIHLVKDFRGRRYIERVTECIPIENKNEYNFDHRKEKTLEGKLDKFFDNAAIFFSKTTNSELYTYRNILEFVDDRYVLSNPISDKNIKEMRLNMNDEDQIAFDNFLERNWGIKPPKTIRYDEDGNEIKPEVIQKKALSEEEKVRNMAKEFSSKMNIEAKKAIGVTETKENSNILRKNIDDIELHGKNVIEHEKNDSNHLENTIKTENIEENKVSSNPRPRRIIKGLGFGKKTANEEKAPEENVIRNELLGGLDFDLEDNDENE